MTPSQKELARHALGLPNKGRKSYRNRFFTSPGSIDHNHWKDMAMEGWAIRYPAEPGQRMDLFELTRRGAEMALEKRETLDTEDFPPPSPSKKDTA